MRVLRTVQLVALGLWVGSGLFFSYVVAPHVFRLFVEQVPAGTSETLPHFDERTGRRVAGATVGAVFPSYFWTQLLLGVAALAASGFLWLRSGGHGLAWQTGLVAVALGALLVQLVWVFPRSEEVLREVHRLEIAGQLNEADQLRRSFGRWHAVSQVLNLVTLGSAALALVLAAWQSSGHVQSGTSGLRQEAEPAAVAMNLE